MPTVDIFSLTKEQIDILCRARMIGKLSKHKSLNNLADGGAQLLRSVGNEVYKESDTPPSFEITEEDEAHMKELFNDPELMKPIQVPLGRRTIEY